MVSRSPIKPCPFVILTGASGVGKTSIAQAIEDQARGVKVYQGDRIGLPSDEIMAAYGPANGPGGDSQRGFALYWIGQIAATLQYEKAVLLETQCRIAFLDESLALHGVSHSRIILVECSDHVRDARLIHDREQPELANENMAGWSRYLHQEAVEAGHEILDTSNLSLADSVDRVLCHLLRQ